MKRIYMTLLILIAFTLTGCNEEEEEILIASNTLAYSENISQSNIIESIDKSNLEHDNKSDISIEFQPITTEVNIKMVGDNLIHSPIYKSALSENGVYNFDFMFEHISEEIESADIAIINQETIFINDRNKISSYPMFGSPTEVGDAIINAGFDVVAHATNHTIDKNLQGINDTIAFWEEKYPGTLYLGIHDSEEDSDIAYLTENDIKFAFVNYTYGLNGLESWRTGNEYMIDMLSDSDIEATLAEAETNADLTVAILHIGNEYVYEPTTYQQEQIDRFIDNGADIILCAHPHVLQPYEIRETTSGNSALVYYSLGNFISNQNEIPRILGGMADITISKTVYEDSVEIVISDYNLIPLVTHQEVGYYTTYKLEDYTDELCARHKLYNKGLSIDKINELLNNILN